MNSRCLLTRKGLIILSIIVLDLFIPSFHTEVDTNDLWFLISSYEDIGITVDDLAKFLVAHGYNAKPEGSYVTVTLSGGKKNYLTPNGGASGLADMWQILPSEPTQPTIISKIYAIKKDPTYQRTFNSDFRESLNRSVRFPIAPLGRCYEGSKVLGKIYKNLGYNVTYMYRQNNPGHEWILVEDNSSDTWLAADSYFGTVINSDYYTASYSFPDPSYLDLVNPKWRIA
ncbi:Uncharacterised protein [uncultured archaeon]|nr:Uncharacterised protein [uncultured archaeon]